MNEKFREFITRLIRERPGGFFRFKGFIPYRNMSPWEPFQLGGMSDWVFEFDMPKTTFAVYPHLLKTVEHYTIPFSDPSGAQAVHNTMKMLREDAGIYGVSVFSQQTHATAFLAFFNEQDAVVVQGLFDVTKER